MAKQRKLLEQSDSNTFFDEMEQEMNKVCQKRRKIHTEPTMPPEKLFLQFDPRRMEELCKKNLNSQPLPTLKSQWKPPIKTVGQPERYDPSTAIIPDKNNTNNEEITWKSNEDAVNLTSINDVNFLAENRSEDMLITEENEENDEVISLNSSQDLIETYSPEVVSDVEKNKCDKHEILNEGDEKVVLSNESIKPNILNELEENIITFSDKELAKVAEGSLQRYSNSYCHPLEKNECNGMSKTLNILPYKNEEVCFGSKQQIINLSNSSCFDESNITLDTSELMSKDEAVREEIDIKTQQETNCKLMQNSGEKKLIAIEMKTHKTDITTNAEITNKVLNVECAIDISNNRNICCNEITSTENSTTAEDAEINIVYRSTITKLNNEKSDEISGGTLDEGDEESAHTKEIDSEIKLKNYNSNLILSKLCEKAESQNIDGKLLESESKAITVEADNSEIKFGIALNEAQKLYGPAKSNTVENGSTIVKTDCAQVDSTLKDLCTPDHHKNINLKMGKPPNEKVENTHGPCSLANTKSYSGNSSGFCISTDNNSKVISIEDGNIVSIQNLEYNNIVATLKNHGSIETNINKKEGMESNLHQDYQIQYKDCSYHTNDNLERNALSNNIEEETDQNTQEYLEHPSEVENALEEENVDIMDEEYSCLMISNSQLEEIEKNYYETSNITANVVPNDSCSKNSQNENHITGCTNVAGEGPKSKPLSVIHPQNILCSNGLSSKQKCPISVPRVQWPKTMLDKQKKIRELVGEIDRLNALLMEFRREIWPQRHLNTST